MSNYKSDTSIFIPSYLVWCLWLFFVVLSLIVPKGNFLSDLIGFIGISLLILAIILSTIKYFIFLADQKKREILAIENESNKKKNEIIVKENILINFTKLKEFFNEDIASAIFLDLKNISTLSDAKDFYNSALDLISIHKGDPKVKVFALDVGRWYYGLRSYGGITTHDEQTMQNDINVRS